EALTIWPHLTQHVFLPTVAPASKEPGCREKHDSILASSVDQRSSKLQEKPMRTTLLSWCVVSTILMHLTGIVFGQIATPNANLTTTGLIPIPGWSPATGGAFDLGTFNPVNRLMYFADGTNHAVTTVDTV